MRRLENKIALVTGGGAGIGQAIAETFAREGAQVVIADRDGQAAAAVAQAISKGNGEALARVVDVGDRSQVKQLMATIGEAFGRLDTLVNNAGIGPNALNFHQYSDDDWARVWRVNVGATVSCSREAFDLLNVSVQASIINVSSVVATKHLKKTSIYSTTKGVVATLSRNLAAEYARYGIRVNCLCPGHVETALTSQLSSDPAYVRYMLGRIPLRRFGMPQDIANAALFLASDEAAYVTGASLSIDGGLAFRGDAALAKSAKQHHSRHRAKPAVPLIPARARLTSQFRSPPRRC